MRPLAVLLLAGCSTLPPPTPHEFVAPPRPTTDISICWVDTGGLSAPARYGGGGSVKADSWEVTSAALLIRHPSGDVLLDTGISPTAKEDAKSLSTWNRFVFDNTAGRNVARESLVDTLKAVGVTKLKAVILSHAHPDHAGGLTVLPDVPVWLASEEKSFIESGNQAVVPAHVKTLTGRMEPLTFEPIPYANYDSRADVFGDGSVVVVPAFGHTPGSVVTFVNTPKLRLAHVGDLINLGESLSAKQQKSFLMRSLTDE
ncbi:MAG: MBL fold metallo-hydrolase, partial [Archangium sp.]